MHILTEENKLFNMNEVPHEVDDIRFCVLDYSDPRNVDYVFLPLLFLESFNSPVAEVMIGKNLISLPLYWYIVVGEREGGNLELLSIKQLNDRDFQAFCFNPLKGFIPKFLDLSICNVHMDIIWHTPKLRDGNILVVPINNGPNPDCCLLVHDTNKIPEVLDISQIL